MDRGAWWATVLGVTNSWTQLSTHTSMNAGCINIIEANTVFLNKQKKHEKLGTSLVIQWLRLCFQCRGQGFNPWSANWVPKCLVAKKKKERDREKLKSSENSFQCSHYYLCMSFKSSFKCFLSSISSCRIILYSQGIYNPPWTYFPLSKCYREYILILMRFLLRDKKGIQTHLWFWYRCMFLYS